MIKIIIFTLGSGPYNVYSASSAMISAEVNQWKPAKTNYSPGTYSVIWNGVNQSGKPVGSGMYLVRLNSSKYNATQKVLLMK